MFRQTRSQTKKLNIDNNIIIKNSINFIDRCDLYNFEEHKDPSKNLDSTETIMQIWNNWEKSQNNTSCDNI